MTLREVLKRLRTLTDDEMIKVRWEQEFKEEPSYLYLRTREGHIETKSGEQWRAFPQKQIEKLGGQFTIETTFTRRPK